MAGAGGIGEAGGMGIGADCGGGYCAMFEWGFLKATKQEESGAC